MSISDQAQEIWRQADDQIALLEHADNVPTKAEWDRYREQSIRMYHGWRNRLRQIGKDASDGSSIIQRQWNFPEGPDDEQD